MHSLKGFEWLLSQPGHRANLIAKVLKVIELNNKTNCNTVKILQNFKNITEKKVMPVRLLPDNEENTAGYVKM